MTPLPKPLPIDYDRTAAAILCLTIETNEYSSLSRMLALCGNLPDGYQWLYQLRTVDLM